MEKYENPMEHACDMEEGQVFIANGWEKPEGLCESAWETMSPFVMALAHGAENFYEGWMKNPKSAMLSCNDGFRPVSFLVETLDEEISVLMEYMPEQLSIEEVNKIIDEAFDVVKPTSQKEMGLIMKEVTPKLKGKADMKEVSNIIKEKLSNL
jgi:uncharacterized repeat protein (TIGR04076 family)